MQSVRTLSESRYSKVSVITCIVLVWFHVQAVAAFWSFTWTNLLVAFALSWVGGGLGISAGYHRLHTHRGYKTHKWFEYFLAICGTLTLEGGPIFWVATHRLHHQYSISLKIRTRHASGFWAHIGWILFGESHHNDTARMSRYAPDLAKDPFYRWLTTYHGCRSPCSAFPCLRSADGGSSTGRSSSGSWSACIQPIWSTQPRTCGAAVDSPPATIPGT
jgi:stearoyl-CoA desaturase (delta-9 desaturase)